MATKQYFQSLKDLFSFDLEDDDQGVHDGRGGGGIESPAKEDEEPLAARTKPVDPPEAAPKPSKPAAPRFDYRSDDKALDRAQADRDRTQLRSRLGQAFAGMAESIAGAQKGTVDRGYWQSLEKTADQPVRDVLGRREQVRDDEKSDLTRDLGNAQIGRYKAEAEKTAQGAKLKDPDSVQSMLARKNMAKELQARYPGVYDTTRAQELVAGQSAEQLYSPNGGFQKYLDRMEGARTQAEQRELDRQARKDLADQASADRRAIAGQASADRRFASEQAADAKTQTAEDKKAAAAEKASKLSEKQLTGLTDMDTALDGIKAVLHNKEHGGKDGKGFDTGPLSGRWNAAAGFLGMDDSEKTAFRSQVQRQLNDYIHKISGAGVPLAEVPRLLAGVPTMNDNDESFKTKADNLLTELTAIRNRNLGNLKKSGKDVSEFEQEELPSSGDPASAAPSSQKVLVVGPDGKQHRLPADQVEDAVQNHGFKVVQ